MTELIDAWTHIMPPAYLALLRARHSETGRMKRWLTLTTLHDLEARFRLMDRFENYRQVLTLSFPPIEELFAPEDAADAARVANDGLADLVARHPDRFVGFVAALSMLDPRTAVAEVERAAKLGASGFQIPTHILGRPLDHPDFEAVFEAISRTGLAVWLHPCRTADTADYASEERSRFEIWWCFGWPYESTAAMSRLVFSGLLDRYPNLRIFTHHMGGMVPYFAGRISQGLGAQMGTRTGGQEADLLPAQLKRPPIEYFRNFYADTAVSGDVAAMACGLAFFKVPHVMFASDFPFDAEGGAFMVRETLRAIDELPLDAADKRAICEGNVLAFIGRDEAHKSAGLERGT